MRTHSTTELLKGTTEVTIGLDGERYLICSFCKHPRPIAHFMSKRHKALKMCEHCRGYVAKHRQKYVTSDKEEQLKRLYGINIADLESLQNKQQNVCAICGKPETAKTRKSGKTRRLAVDHNHSTGKVRGLLCAHCNTIIGHVESLGIPLNKWITKALTYLEESD